MAKKFIKNLHPIVYFDIFSYSTLLNTSRWLLANMPIFSNEFNWLYKNGTKQGVNYWVIYNESIVLPW